MDDKDQQNGQNLGNDLVQKQMLSKIGQQVASGVKKEQLQSALRKNLKLQIDSSRQQSNQNRVIQENLAAQGPDLRFIPSNQDINYESSRSLISQLSEEEKQTQKDYSLKESSILDMTDTELNLNHEKITQAIKDELQIRIQNNFKVSKSGLNVGGKDINQIIGQKFQFDKLSQNLPTKKPESRTETPRGFAQLSKLALPDKLPVQLDNIDKKRSSQFHTMHPTDDGFEELQFQEPLSLREEKLEGTSKKKFGISIWKLNRGQQAYQINEHPFNLTPALQKFFVSHDAKHIIILLINEGEEQYMINSIRILNIETLKIVYELKSTQIQSFTHKQIVDISLIWNSTYLFIQTLDYAYFLNVQTQRFEQIYELDQQTTKSSRIMKHPIFKESDPMQFYSVVLSTKSTDQGDLETYSLYQTNLLKSDDIFEQKNFMMPIVTLGSSLEYDKVIGYNKYLTQIVFPGEQVYYIFNIRSKNLKSYRNVQNCQLQKNCFLQDNIWLAFNDDNYDTFAISTQNIQKKYHLSNLDLDDFRLGDIMRERQGDPNEQQILSIGKKGEKEASSRICINVSKQDGQQPYINYIQETSDYVFSYPFIMYCKGNSELFIQNMNQPERLIKLDLDDQFLCFADVNHHIKLKPLHIALGLSDGNQSFRSFESVAFLTQSDDKIFFNILEYAPYSYEKHYTLFKSIQFIQRPKTQYGNIVKAVFQKVKHRECKDQDFILILQYRNHILIRSFFNLFVLNIEKYIYKFPMIYEPSKYKDQPDICFYISKDGYSTKIERLGFNGKEHKDPISTAYELKTQNIFVFCKHEKFFYLMDDTLSLKKFEYDKRSQKLKLVKLFEFATEYRDILAQSVDYHDIQVTDKGVYRGLLFVPYYETNNFNKDINMIKTDPILNIAENELFSGPKKLEGTQYLLYMARGDKKILQGDLMNQFEGLHDNDSFEDIVSDEDEVSVSAEIHNIPKYSPAKSKEGRDSDLQISSSVKPTNYKQLKSINSQLSRSKTIHRHAQSQIEQDLPLNTIKQPSMIQHKPTLSIISSQTADNLIDPKGAIVYRKSFDEDDIVTKITESKTLRSLSKSKITQKTKKSGKSNAQVDDEQVYAWIVPYLDSNVIHFTHNIKENSNPKYQVTFSTFINNQDEILCEINKVFYVFSKNGTFLYQVNTIRDKNKNAFYFQQNKFILENVSTNLTYYLFYDPKNKSFEAYKLVRDKIEDEELKRSLSKFKYSRIKSYQFRQSFNQSKNLLYDQYVQPYIFKHVKTIKEYSELRIKEDYFNQRLISNIGDVYQLVQYRRSQIKRALNKQMTINFNKYAAMIDVKQIPTPNEIGQDDDISKLCSTEAQSIFKFYIDNKDISRDLISKFKLIKDHVKQTQDPIDESRQFGFIILGDYLYIKRELQLEYLKIFEQDTKLGTKRYIQNNPNKTKFIHLILDPYSKILRIIGTANKSPRLIQIIVSDERFMYVITWDVDKNIEHQMMQIEKKFDFNAGHIVCKGITERHNYIPIDNSLYDLYFGLPFKFFQNINSKFPKKCKMNMNERKLSQFNKEYLDLFENNKILKSYTYLDLCYLKAFQNLNKDQIEQQHMMIRHLHVRIEGQTFFSFIALDFNLLRQLFQEIIKIDEQGGQSLNNENNITQQQKMLFIHTLYPNYANMSAFDIAMERKSPKSIEMMLDMLCELGDFSLSKFFMHHFSELFQMELLSFQKFLSSCLFQLPRMREIRVLKWIHDEDEYYTDYHTSYLGDSFYKKIQKHNLNFLHRNHHDEFEVKGQEKTLITDMSVNQNHQDSQLKMQEEIIEDENSSYGILGKPDNMMMRNEGTIENMQWKKEYEVGELKRVETFAVEFDWIFRGKNAVSFIEHLAHSANDSIFAVDTIRIIVLFLWARFFYNIRNKIFIPFIVYFTLFMIQIALIYQQLVYIQSVRSGRTQSEETFSDRDYEKWVQADYAVISVLLVLWAYFLLIEISQANRLRMQYLKDFWNWLDIASLGLNLTYLVRDIVDADPHNNRVISSLAALLMWLKLLYFLRLFAPTAALIRMIVEICKDMFVFTIIYFIAIIGFADAFYILAYNLQNDEVNEMFNNNFFLSILYSYRTGLGDFNTVAFDNSQDQGLWYILFITQTVFIQIIMLNLLIAIMGDTFEKVTEKKEESKLKEICEMISDYEGIMNRDNEFRHSKYIVVVKVEKAQANNNSDWEGRLSSLKNFFSSIIQDLRKESKQANDNIREEVIGNAKAMEQKFLDLQQLIMKQSTQVSLALKKMDKVSEDVKKIKKRKTFYAGNHTVQHIPELMLQEENQSSSVIKDIKLQEDQLNDTIEQHTPQITMLNI